MKKLLRDIKIMAKGKIKARVIEENEYYLWDDLVRSSPQGSIFTSIDWLQASSEYCNYPLRLFGCFDGDVFIGGCPIYIHKTNRILSVASTTAFMSPYGGILLPYNNCSKVRDIDSKNNKIINTIIGEIVKNNYDIIQIINSPNLVDVRPLSWSNWKTHVLYTYSLSLRSQLPKSISKKARSTIRKAEKSNINTHKKVDLERYWGLTLDTYNKQNKKPPFSKQYLTKMIDMIIRNNIGEMWIAESESGEIASAEIIVWDNKKAHRWLAASNYNLRDTGATSLLLFEIFQDLQSRGYPEINLMAGNTPQLSMFISGFNPDLAPYYKLEKNITTKGRICHQILDIILKIKESTFFLQKEI